MIRLIAPLCVCILLAACASLPGGVLSTHDEILLGVQLARETESQELIYADDEVQAYVDHVGRRLVGVAQRTHIPYTFTVLDDDSAADVFALPGGYTYIYTGMLLACQNEAELAAAIAHELAHVIERHHGEALVDEYGFRVVMGQILGSDAATTGPILDDLLRSAQRLEFSERQERAADRVSMDLLIRAGYDPEAKATLLLRQLEETSTLAYHPFSTTEDPTPERIDNVYELFYDYPEAQRGGFLGEEEYQERVLAKLKKPQQ